jgi:cytoskeletal protein CcmA (bactofilin family)
MIGLRKKLQIEQTEYQAYIGNDTKVLGNFIFNGRCILSGIIEGDIVGDYMEITEGGFVKGRLKLKGLKVKGSVEGDIDSEEVEIFSTGSISGELITKCLRVENGGIFSGRSIMGNSEKIILDKPL